MAQIRVIVPTYQAEKHLASLLPALRNQGLQPDDVLVIDSSSKDRTVAQFREFGARVVVIPQSEFNHGGTRRMAVELCLDAEFVVLLTQDAIPATGAIHKLLEAFQQPEIGVAYGRQCPRPQAAAIERHARLLNYPERPSEVRSFEDRGRFGVKTTFCSNSFAAYRVQALLEVGNFPAESFFGEDQITSGRLLMAGWQLAYVSEAEATHSHGYSIRDDFKRYFDVGVFHSRNEWLLENFGKAEGEGLRFIRSELRYLLQNAPWLIPSALSRTLLKYTGYRLGRMERLLPGKAKMALSMAPYYWRKPSGN